MAQLELKPYTGWRPYAMKVGKAKHEGDRGSKRSRIGKAKDRALYKSCKGHKIDPARFAKLSAKADALNGIRR